MFHFYVLVVAAGEDNSWKETLCGGVTEVNVATATKNLLTVAILQLQRHLLFIRYGQKSMDACSLFTTSHY